MNTYEALIVFKPFLDVDNTESLLKGVENTIQNLKGKVIKVDKVGRKRLAYEISKFKDGFIATFYMELPPEAIVDFKKFCQLNEDILRLTLLNMDGVDINTLVSASVAHKEREHHRGDKEHHHHHHHHRDRGGDRPPRVSE